VKQWERLYGSREIALYCGHVWVTRAWLCSGTTLTEIDFVSGDTHAIQEETNATKSEGFHVDRGVFYFNTTTRSQMTSQGSWTARETAHRRMQKPRNAVLPDVFSPGPQACILATNGENGYVPSLGNASRRGRPNDGVVGGNPALLCACTPIEITTLEELRTCRFVQVIVSLK
jgi:hypothetical protein